MISHIVLDDQSGLLFVTFTQVVQIQDGAGVDGAITMLSTGDGNLACTVQYNVDDFTLAIANVYSDTDITAFEIDDGQQSIIFDPDYGAYNEQFSVPYP